MSGRAVPVPATGRQIELRAGGASAVVTEVGKGRSDRMSDRWETGRLEAFSDGVLAIAITLLVLELSVPEADFEHLWRGIADQWPSYLAYVTSFTTIGAIWLVHHGMFRRLACADSVITRLNLLLLMLASFMPFPTKLVAEAVDSGHGSDRR